MKRKFIGSDILGIVIGLLGIVVIAYGFFDPDEGFRLREEVMPAFLGIAVYLFWGAVLILKRSRGAIYFTQWFSVILAIPGVLLFFCYLTLVFIRSVTAASHVILFISVILLGLALAIYRYMTGPRIKQFFQ